MAINLFILILCCVIALVWPIWGIALLLILTSTLFNLSQYATVPLPVGYIEPTEAILFSLLLRILWDWWQRGSQPFRNNGSGSHERFAKKVLISAIVPYVIWQTICCARGIIMWQGTEHFRFAFRFLISGVFTWSFVAIVWAMRHQTKNIIRVALVIAFATGLVHLVIQVLDYRPLMQAAYWRFSTEYAFGVPFVERIIMLEPFVRGLPQGIILMLYSLIYAFSYFLVRWKHSKYRFYMLALLIVQVLAIAVTFTRSLATQAIVGCLMALLFALTLRIVHTQIVLNRTVLGIGGVFIVLALYMMVKPGFSNLWLERIRSFSGVDYKIFSVENEARGKDNIASFNAIVDHPIFGCGTPRYPSEYSLRDLPPTDIHPILQVGLMGGIPAIILVLRLQWIIFWRFLRASIDLKRKQRQLVGYLSIIAMTLFVINLCGAGGTLMGSSLVSMAMFIGLMAAEFASPVAHAVTASKEHGEEKVLYGRQEPQLT